MSTPFIQKPKSIYFCHTTTQVDITYVIKVTTHYNGLKVVDVVSIISPFHSVKLELLFQNGKTFPLKLRICEFFLKRSLKNPTYYLCFEM